MKIGFDAKRAYQNFTGLGNYSRDLIENLISAKKMGWRTIWISPKFIEKPDYIDYAFPNIFQALLFFKESI